VLQQKKKSDGNIATIALFAVLHKKKNAPSLLRCNQKRKGAFFIVL
jgi:hypothetical protein